MAASDLQPGVYEGGFKLWEGSDDLIRCLQQHHVERLKEAQVLELGCGHGLPSIYAAKKGAKEVHLQDYNIEVIEQLTMPNVDANLSTFPDCSVRYFAGDWRSLPQALPAPRKYDIILTAETGELVCLPFVQISTTVRSMYLLGDV